MATSFENFVNTELPKRIATNESPTTPQAGDIPVFSGVGLLTESKTASDAGLATETFATNAANTAETNAKSYADSLITSIYKFQTTYNPQTTGNFPTTANTVGGVAIKKGFTWVVSGVTGQYTFQGVTVDNGDTLLALVDDASSTSAADWHITEKNLGYTPENSSNKYSDNDLAGSAGTYPATPSVKAYVDNGLSGKQNTLPDVITAGAYGNSTQYPIVTVNAKGIVTGVTLQTVAPTFSDSAFRIQDNGDATKQLALEVSGIATATTRGWTAPNADINFGDLSAVATTNSNTLSGTRTRIVGGSSNTVSGTDNVVVGCTAVTTSSSLGQYIQASSGSTAGIDWPTRFIGSGTLRGTTTYNTELAEVITQLKALNIYDAGSEVLTTDGGAATASNTPKHAGACPYDDATSNVATHELDLQVVTRFSTGFYTNTGITHAKYLIAVIGTTAVATTVATCANGTVATFTVTPTVVSGRLYITVANTTGSDKPVRVRGVLKSLYSYL